jgi:hypothetical protein
VRRTLEQRRSPEAAGAFLLPGLQIIANNFANPWPVEVGRVDRTEAGPTAIPALDAPVPEIRVRQERASTAAQGPSQMNVCVLQCDMWDWSE